MNEIIKMFDYHGAKVTVIMKDGEPLFEADHVCRILEYKQTPKDVIKRKLDKDEKVLLHKDDFKGSLKDPFGNRGEKWFITEPGLYVLIGRSNKPEAKKFRRWINHEVIPSIRKTGKYEVQPKSDILVLAEAIVVADKVIKKTQKLLETEQEDHKETRLLLETEKVSHKETEQELLEEKCLAWKDLDMAEWCMEGVNRIAVYKKINPGTVRITSYVIYNRLFNENLQLQWSIFRQGKTKKQGTLWSYLVHTGKLGKYARVLEKMFDMSREDIAKAKTNLRMVKD